MCKIVNGETVSLFENSVASGMNTHSRLSILHPRNFKRSVLCFLLGICFFLPCSCSSLQETVIFIPVDSSQIPVGLTITGPLVKGIEVHVRGPKSTVKILSDLKIRYVLDLSGAHVGINSIPIKKDRIILPEGISIVKINPTFLTVTIENEIKKELPVKILFSGKPATGFTVAGAVAKPLSVILQGPENILGPMDKVLTKPIGIKMGWSTIRLVTGQILCNCSMVWGGGRKTRPYPIGLSTHNHNLREMTIDIFSMQGSFQNDYVIFHPESNSV